MSKRSHYLLQQILAESAKRFPDREAIQIDGQSITYRLLDEKSNQIAHLLLESGFETRDTAAVLFHKSIEAIASFFGVLKAGGAYISLDLNTAPPERIRQIIARSETRFLVSNSQSIARLASDDQGSKALEQTAIILADGLLFPRQDSSLGDIRVKCSVYRYRDDLARSTPPDPCTTDDDLAYILYTSGSTGEPKGVMLSHLNALTFINWSLDTFRPSPEDVFANHAPFQFDLSVFDIYVSLSSGARLSIVPPGIAANPRALLTWISEHKITCWYSVPSVWVSMINYAGIESVSLDSLRCILFAGEVCPPKYLRTLMETLPQASYYNLYGPTETNVCTYYRVENIDDIGDRPVPIGRACANTEVVALSKKNEPIAVGEEGELLVKGSTVFKGYYKDEEKTNQLFLRSPFSYHQGARLYRTGDIVRKLDALNYEYVGRRDLMVKCAGYRIELPEIEHALCLNELIEEAAVTPLLDGQKLTTSLHAFIKTKNDEDISIVALKSYLGQTLPKYMIPEAIERIDDIPKNTNGKIDRHTLTNRLAS